MASSHWLSPSIFVPAAFHKHATVGQDTASCVMLFVCIHVCVCLCENIQYAASVGPHAVDLICTKRDTVPSLFPPLSSAHTDPNMHEIRQLQLCPMTIYPGLDSMHICLDFIAELQLAQPRQLTHGKTSYPQNCLFGWLPGLYD